MTIDQTTPLTDEQLNQIEARANVATSGPWERYEEYGPHFFANITGPYLRGVGTLNFGDGEDADADEEFVKHAVEDVRALVDEIRRLQRQRRFLIDQLAKKGAASGETERRLREFLSGEEQPTSRDEVAATLKQDGFSRDEIADMLHPDIAAADDPTPLRWGLNDVLYGDDDTTTVCLSGPAGEPYWLELDPERAAVLREDLAGPDAEETDTLPAWLYQRFAVIHGTPAWDRITADERAYWEHHARAVRRAVERGGFKAADEDAAPVV